MLLIPALIPCVGGIFAHCFQKKKNLHAYTACIVILTLFFAILTVLLKPSAVTVFHFNDILNLSFAADGLSGFFLILIGVFFVFVSFYSFAYMEHEGHEQKFFTFFLLTLAALLALSMAANALTLYLCFECLTLLSMPLILHNREESSRTAAIYYLAYSVAGASLALCGFFILSRYGGSLSFTTGGGVLGQTGSPELTAAYFLIALGFGAKAGMIPLQAWLPIAHPLAPSPASALLSGVVTKGGVIAILRVTFYLYGADLVRGTWAQTLLIVLSLITVFSGSMLALREKLLKKRFAYSTVSQVSYVLFGIFLLDPAALTGSLLQIVYHAFAKGILFLFAGVMIVQFGFTRVDELKGIGKRTPVLLWCFTLASFSLIGIPPAGGFVSKWFLAEGALNSGGSLGVFGAAVLIVSALLTAFYTLPVMADGFFPGKDFPPVEKKEPPLRMLVPVIVFAVIIMLFGIFPQPITDFASSLARTVL